MKRESLAETMPTPQPDCPFVGLRAYLEEDARWFFGRSAQIDELLRRLAMKRVLAVVGTSGSGKSSLVRAGLLPALKRGYLPEAGRRWRVAVLRPRKSPLGELSKALAGVFTSAGSRQVEEALRGTSLALPRLAQEFLRPEEALLLFVDQFEEIFRFRQTARTEIAYDEADAFVKLLLAAASQSLAPIYLVLTMRSDYLGDCAVFPGLPELLNGTQYLTPVLTRQQLREVIDEPLGIVGCAAHPALTQRILNDVGYGLEHELDQLPVMQHALMRTWQKAKGSHILELAHYEQVNGMSGALDEHAEELLRSLSPAQTRVARKLFQQLCATNRRRDVRRPTPLGELADVAADGDRAAARRVLKCFRPFLDLPAEDCWADSAVIDINHESLIRQWKRLRGEWIVQEAEAAKTYTRLHDDATERAKPWEDPRLSEALRIRKEERWNEAWANRYLPQEDAFPTVQSFLARGVRRRWARYAALGLAVLIIAVTLWAGERWRDDRAKNIELAGTTKELQLLVQAIKSENKALELRAQQEATEREAARLAEAKQFGEAQRVREEAKKLGQHAEDAEMQAMVSRHEANQLQKLNAQQTSELEKLRADLLRTQESVQLRNQELVRLREELGRAIRDRDLMAKEAEAAKVASGSKESPKPLTRTYRVKIVIETASGELGGETADTIVVVFSNQSAKLVSGSAGLDNVEEFLIPGRGTTEPGTTSTHFGNTTDLQWTEACFVRVLNPGTDGWAGASIAIDIDDRVFLERTSLYPRIGSQPKGGIENFNDLDWKEAKYWEKQLKPDCPSASRR